MRRTASGDARDPAVLFLHGFLGSAADWTGTMDALGDGHHRVAVDLPGHGVSMGLAPGAYTTEGAARRVVGVLNELGVASPVMVGYSMGGRLALYLALRYPDRCSGLFLESASPGLETDKERALRRTVDEGRARRLERDGLEKFLRDWYAQPLFAPLARDDALLQHTVKTRLNNDPGELAKSLRGMGTGSQPSLWAELPDLQVPTLAAVGGLDEKFVDAARRMENLSGRVRTTVVPNVGHNVRLEAPEKYLMLMRGFLDSL